MDRASIPADAIEYIKELQQQVKELEEELREMETEDSTKKEVDLHVLALDKNKGGSSSLTCSDHKPISSIALKIPTEVHLVYKVRWLVAQLYKNFQQICSYLCYLGAFGGVPA